MPEKQDRFARLLQWGCLIGNALWLLLRAIDYIGDSIQRWDAFKEHMGDIMSFLLSWYLPCVLTGVCALAACWLHMHGNQPAGASLKRSSRRRIITADQETKMLRILSSLHTNRLLVCTPYGVDLTEENVFFAHELIRVIRAAKTGENQIQVDQMSTGIGERFPTGVSIFWKREGTNEKDAKAIMKAIKATGVSCRDFGRKINAGNGILEHNGIHIYVGRNPMLPSPTLGTEGPEQKPAS